MDASLVSVTFVVRDYDEAIQYFTELLGFALLEDTPLGDGKRWVRVAPGGSPGLSLLLARADTPDQEQAVGNQTGGRVGFFLHTDNFAAAHTAMASRGVKFLEEPRSEAYGVVGVFTDLYGNKWDLIQPVATSGAS